MVGETQAIDPAAGKIGEDGTGVVYRSVEGLDDHTAVPDPILADVVTHRNVDTTEESAGSNP